MSSASLTNIKELQEKVLLAEAYNVPVEKCSCPLEALEAIKAKAIDEVKKVFVCPF